jgi:hypothetical protein
MEQQRSTLQTKSHSPSVYRRFERRAGSPSAINPTIVNKEYINNWK